MCAFSSAMSLALLLAGELRSARSPMVGSGECSSRFLEKDVVEEEEKGMQVL